MQDEKKTKPQLIAELKKLREQVTELKQVDEQLKESEEQYRMLVESMNDGLGIQDENGLITFVNDAFCKMFGYSQEELVGRLAVDLIAPDHRDSFNENMARRRIGETAPYETVFRRKDGPMVHTLMSPQRIEDAEGRFLGSFAVITDITERKKAEDTLRLHSEILENMAEGVLLARTSDGVIIYANTTFERMFGYPPGGLVNKHVSILNASAERDPQETVALIVESLQKSGKWSGEVHNIRADGTTFWTRASISALEHREFGHVWVTVQEDITERKRVEKNLRESEEKYRTLFNAAGDAILLARLTGQDLVFIDCNSRAAAMFGTTREEMMNKMPLDFSPPLQPDGSPSKQKAAEMFRAAREGGSLSFDWRHCRLDGTPFDVEVTLNKVVLGGEICLQGIIRDKTEEKRIEEAFSQISFREQERIRRDLHDSVGQDLTGLSGMARSLAKRLRNHSLPEAEAAENIVRGIQQTFDDVQRAIKGLGPVDMDPSGLMVALEQLIQTTQDQHDMDIRFVCKDQVTVENNSSATHLYRIAQEAITNAVKHANAEHITVSLMEENGRLSLEIHDDGVGIGEEAKHSEGMGLRIMRYRAKTLGAELRIDSPDGDGSCIRCTCTPRDLPSAVR